jgi:hypothetical protein
VQSKSDYQVAANIVNLAASAIMAMRQRRSDGLVFLKGEPKLDDLRSNPRFVNLRQKLNFAS